jgi:DNA-binding transcriptional ArsR family regulator
VNDEQHRADSEPVAVRTVDSVDSLRALADPTRLAILTALMDRHDELPVLSVKELAARLGEPQTKLYRHVKQLEAAGLIQVAATRIVSGIIEQRYQACQHDLMFDGRFLREHADETEAGIQVVLDGFRTGFSAAFRDERLAPDALAEADSFRRPGLFFGEMRMTEAKAREVTARLEEFKTWLGDLGEDPDGILVDVLIGHYVPTEPAGA